jgi:3-methyladenine DNA glycosylase AlkD
MPAAMPQTRARTAVAEWVREITHHLERHATPERAAQEKRYLKSDLDFLGVAMPELRREAKAFVRAHAELERADLLALTHALWRSRVHELRSIAIGILELKRELLAEGDCDDLIELVRDAKTWAYVDWLATKVLGAIVAREAKAKKRLDRWARDDDFWVRRTALLCLHDPLLRGDGDFGHFARLATPMLGEKEFFIRKAIGWVLRSTAKRTPELSYAYVKQHAGEMAGLTFKEATRNLKPKQIATLTQLRSAALDQARLRSGVSRKT